MPQSVIGVVAPLVFLASLAMAQPRYSVTILASHPYLMPLRGESDGTVCGSLSGDGFTHAFIYRNGTITDIGQGVERSTWAYGANASGVVAGELDQDNQPHVFVYDAGAGLRVIEPLGGRYGIAYGVMPD